MAAIGDAAAYDSTAFFGYAGALSLLLLASRVDVPLLRKYISDRGKIRARRVTGNCTRHQRDIAMAVKNAREVALLPYTSTAR